MADPASGTVRESNRYRRPAISGLFDVLDQHVRDRPDARALVVTGDRIPVSCSALAALVDDVAARLGSTGLRRGDAVGLVCANTAEFVVALLGAGRAGLVVAPIDPTIPRPQMSTRLEGLGERAILTGPPAVDAAPVAQFDIPTWELRVDIPVAGNAMATLEPARVSCDTLRGRHPDSRTTTPSSCSPRAAPTGPKWSR